MIRLASDPLAQVFRNGTPVIKEQLSPRDSGLGELASYGFSETFRLNSGMFLPLCGPQKTIGALALYRAGSRIFTAPDESFANELSERITIALTNAALYKASEQANRAKDEFLAVVSHELRTPLVSIIGWASLLLTRGLKSDIADKGLQTIHRNATLQTKLINDILDFSGMGANRLSITLQDVDLRECVQQSIDIMIPIAERKNIRIASQLGKEPIIIEADPVRLQQMIANLLSNAVKFTPAGGHVTVVLGRDANWAHVVVNDTGAGIDPEVLPHIFDPFVQEGRGTTRAHSGLGLGLSIGRRLAELHKGTIRIESPGPGKGTTATLVLPVKLPVIKAS
jgi:signal transduction histidine kinase